MIGIEQRAICDGVNFRSIRDTKFKTMRISAHLIVPMSRQTAAENALLPFLLSRASREYPDFTKLGQRLAELYGASLNADVQKLGDLQVLSFPLPALRTAMRWRVRPFLGNWQSCCAAFSLTRPWWTAFSRRTALSRKSARRWN